jgi:hypothetical protein
VEIQPTHKMVPQPTHKMVPQDADVRRAIDGKALKKNLKIGGSVPGLECPVLHHGRA